MEVGLLLVRLVTGLLLAGHGAQKLFGWFGGQVPSESGEPVGEAAGAAEPLGAGPRRGRSATRGPSAPWP